MDVVDRIFKVGEAPIQHRIQSEGNSYLQKDFPKLTYIESARVLSSSTGNDGNSIVAGDADKSKLAANMISRLLSSGCPATADVRGNLGPAGVVTSSKNDNWLKDRFQFASDMNGTPIPGSHWIQIDLENDSIQAGQLTSARIDWETANADDYHIECASSASGPYTRIIFDRKNRVAANGGKHILDDLDLKGTAQGDTNCRYVRLFIERPATKWGASVYELKIFGRSQHQC